MMTKKLKAAAIAETVTDTNLPALPASFDLAVPENDDGRIDLFNRADVMTGRVEVEGRWLCGHALHGSKLSSAQISEQVFAKYGRRTAVRNIDYVRQFYKKVPEYADVKLLSGAGLTWTTVRDMLTLEETRRLPQFIEGVREGFVNADNADEAVAELKSVVDGGTHGEPLPVDGVEAKVEGGEKEEAGEMEFEAEKNAAAILKDMEKLHDKVEGMSDRLVSKVSDVAEEIPKECRKKLLGMLEEISQECRDIADLLDGVATTAAGALKKK